MTRLALLGPANSIHLQRWAQALVSRGHELLILSQHPCERDLLPAKAEVRWLPHRGNVGYFLNAWSLRRWLTEWQPQLLNAHYASGYGTTMALCGFQPTLLSVWGSDVFDFPKEGAAKRQLLVWNLNRATAVASTSQVMARQVQALTPSRQTVAVTPFGVDLARFAPAPGRQAKRPLTLGMVKTLAHKYGVDLLLQAFAELLQDKQVAAAHPALRLRIVGDGPDRAELHALTHSLQLQQRVDFTGAVPHDEVPAALRSFDIYAAPSRLDSESFGVAVIEASACGLPVVVSDAGGLPEVVLDGRTGLVVPRDDVPALFQALRRLVLDAGLRRRLGQAGRAHVEATYEWGHCVGVMEQAYDAVLAGQA